MEFRVRWFIATTGVCGGLFLIFLFAVNSVYLADKVRHGLVDTNETLLAVNVAMTVLSVASVYVHCRIARVVDVKGSATTSGSQFTLLIFITWTASITILVWESSLNAAVPLIRIHFSLAVYLLQLLDIALYRCSPLYGRRGT